MQLRTDDLTWNVVGDDVIALDLKGSVYLQLSGSGRSSGKPSSTAGTSPSS